MRIAFVSYEFPTETGGGGIGTYLEMITRLLLEAGHSVVAFAGTKKEKAFWETEWIYRIPSGGWQEFNDRLPQYFLPVHEKHPFDVLEGTDFRGCGLSIKRLIPELPVVVRLHTPLFLVDKLAYRPLPFIHKMRFLIGALIRFQLPQFPSAPHAEEYKDEFNFIDAAETVSSPSVSITKEMVALGFNLSEKTELVPLPFNITPDFVEIEPKKILQSAPQIIFIGRLELRKGVIDLVMAIPTVLKKNPGTHFTFIGEASVSPVTDVDMATYLKGVLKDAASSVTFTGKVSQKKVMDYLAAGDIFVLPSHYESFGLVCCEAMAAGKAVIGSKNGGMAEIIEQNKSGILIPPKQPDAIANAILELIADNAGRVAIGRAARQRIKEYLSPTLVIARQLLCYQHAIEQAKQRNEKRLNLPKALKNRFLFMRCQHH